jgi:hypothetical protein
MAVSNLISKFYLFGQQNYFFDQQFAYFFGQRNYFFEMSSRFYWKNQQNLLE